LPEWTDLALAAVAGSTLFMVGFGAMHDASHYALGTRDSWKNHLVMRLWNSVAHWDSGKWLYHHMVRHHSFTGDLELDPDVVHAAPFIRKHKDAELSEYHGFLNQSWFSTTTLRSYSTTFVYAGVLHVAQVLMYNVSWNKNGELWNLKIERTQRAFAKFWWEYALSLAVVAAHLVKADLAVSLVYLFSASMSYGMCILADHDTYESGIENHLDGGVADWGEIQVRHAADFASNPSFSSRLFTELFGSINAQIGHHLFPSVNHVHLRALVPIIKQTCEEFDVPYASHGTLLGALASVSKMFQATNQDARDKVKAKSHGE
jgi:fatty acid desaturase